MKIKSSVRFQVFKRDGFTCVYCGRKVPEVILEVDHIVAQSCGGQDGIGNLATSCRDCNVGKSNRPLQEVPAPLGAMFDERKEQMNQMESYQAFLKEESERIGEWLAESIRHWEGQETENNYPVIQKFRSGLKLFVRLLPLQEVKESIDLAFERFPQSYNAYRRGKFFCGICWNKIKGAKNVRQAV